MIDSGIHRHSIRAWKEMDVHWIEIDGYYHQLNNNDCNGDKKYLVLSIGENSTHFKIIKSFNNILICKRKYTEDLYLFDTKTYELIKETTEQ